MMILMFHENCEPNIKHNRLSASFIKTLSSEMILCVRQSAYRDNLIQNLSRSLPNYRLLISLFLSIKMSFVAESTKSILKNNV